ncbi:MAG: beta-ketoacyl-ACP synthase III [Deltaproteobacteria bacterium]|nr:beta-ketoacyl-ACP synthase III [Deltaproteobacteria bacterium]
MTSKNVYITDLAGFLPNDPVDNDNIEAVLGMVGGKPSHSRRLVLRNNGIKTRHYAIDPSTGGCTHSNAQLAAEAVRRLSAKSGVALDEMECLCCGTSSPDLLQPSHGQMVHGALGSRPCEVVTTAGVCSSGITSMKYAYMSVALGLTNNAVATGSELVSGFMRASNFEPEMKARVEKLEKHPAIGFEKDFLRWMLSDGAGAALLSARPREDKPSLCIEWIDYLSFAGDMPVCMYSGAVRQEDGALKAWREIDDPMDVVRWNYMSVKQDARILDEHIMKVSVERALIPIAKKRSLQPEDVTWFLPHYSSEYFRPRLHDTMNANGFGIPYERWFTNLTSKGNIGSAAIYLIIEELLDSGALRRGDTLLCYIPESARFSICYMLLKVV